MDFKSPSYFLFVQSYKVHKKKTKMELIFMEKNYADVLDKYQISQELWVSYSQKYDENKKSNEKLSLDDLTVITITEENYEQLKRKYRKLDLPISIFTRKNFFKSGEIWVRVFDGTKVVASAEIWKSDLAIEEGIAKHDTVPYDKSKTYLNDLTIRKEYQGRGIGRQLVKYMIKHFNIGYLDTFAEGEVATRLYQSEGFKIYYKTDEINYMKR